MPARLADVVNLADLEDIARARAPRTTWDYYAAGSDDERCLARNVAAYERVTLAYRVLAGVGTRDLATTVLGERVAMPILIAPTAFQRLAHREGELASVRAAGDAGTIFICSTLANTSIEDVVATSAGPVWFQLFVYRDRGATEALVRRAEAAGARALVLTVDTPLLGRRERDVRNRFALPPDLRAENLLATGYAPITHADGDSGLASYVAALLDPGLSWDAIGWLRSITTLPILVKGIVRPDDAARAIAEGAAGVIVSNHGGRQLDASPATIDALPRIVDAVGGRGEVLVDGGIRRGTDVVKALASGARAVLVGRPVLWGLIAGGRAGVGTALAILRRELDLAMALCGCPTVAQITRDLLA
ncbi:MAG: alpha-hydroxy acid oxidase [Proteobacteria bacterium]|nr:alpha-hydroxy acid oxidase [Pseudomonadota bacterium]